MKLQRFAKLLLSSILAITLMSGCSKPSKGSEEFEAYADSFPALISENIHFDINFLFDHPETYGIERELYDLDYVSLEDYKKNMEILEEKFKELDEYDYDQLNEDQKIVYDLLKYNAQESDIDVETMYYLSTNYFDTNSGIQAQLPLSLWNYEFKNKKSADSFLAVLKEAPEMFPRYVALEKERQEKGFGMSQTYLNDVQKAIHTINTSDQSYILDAAYEKIDQVSFFDAQAKEAYKREIQTAFEESFLPAFQSLEHALDDLDVKKSGEGELSSYPSGKTYYESIVCENAGVDSMKEYEKFLKAQQGEIVKRLQDLIEESPNLSAYIMDSNAFVDAMQNLRYTDLTTSTEVIASLEEEIAKSEEFPHIQKLHYQMNVIPDTMKETTLAAAAYYLSAFDDHSGQDEQMMLNGSFKQEDFTTIAHESFPGHMYQHNYFKTVDHHIVRDLLSSNGYSEGWAKYIEKEVCDLSLQPGLCQLLDINNQLTYLMILDLDKQIHYDGISREEAYAFMKENFGIEDEESLAQQYQQLLENPGIFSTYYASYYNLLEMKDAAKEALGDEYSDYRFHETILNLGPLPIKLLKQYTGWDD